MYWLYDLSSPSNQRIGALDAKAPAKTNGYLILSQAANIPPYDPPTTKTGAFCRGVSA